MLCSTRAARLKLGKYTAMNSAINKISLAARIMILVACCALLMPAHAPAKGNGQLPIFHTASFMLASSGIVAPVSNLKTFSPAECTSLSCSGKRQQKNTSPSGGADFPAALHLITKLPPHVFCVREYFSAHTSSPKSHGRIHWHSLAPPASQSA